MRPSRSKTFRFRVRVERSTPRTPASSVIESDRSKATVANVENCEISRPRGSRAALYRRASKFAVFRACSAKQRSPIVLIWLRRRSLNSSSMLVMCIYTMILSREHMAAASTHGPVRGPGAGSGPGDRVSVDDALECGPNAAPATQERERGFAEKRRMATSAPQCLEKGPQSQHLVAPARHLTETMMKRADLTEKILDIKRENGWTWKHICGEIGGFSPILITAALLGQMKLTRPQAQSAAKLFGLSKEAER